MTVTETATATLEANLVEEESSRVEHMICTGESPREKQPEQHGPSLRGPARIELSGGVLLQPFVPQGIKKHKSSKLTPVLMWDQPNTTP